MPENTDQLPVTEELVSLIHLLKARFQYCTNQNTLAKKFGVHPPLDWWIECKKLFFSEFSHEVIGMGLPQNEITFRTLTDLMSFYPEDLNTTPYADLPKLFAFDPWKGIIKLDPKPIAVEPTSNPIECKCPKCGANMTKPDSVIRTYSNKNDGPDKECTGFYKIHGDSVFFETNRNMSFQGGRYDLLSDSDKCAHCDKQI